MNGTESKSTLLSRNGMPVVGKSIDGKEDKRLFARSMRIGLGQSTRSSGKRFKEVVRRFSVRLKHRSKGDDTQQLSYAEGLEMFGALHRDRGQGTNAKSGCIVEDCPVDVEALIRQSGIPHEEGTDYLVLHTEDRILHLWRLPDGSEGLSASRRT